ncbi:short-chain dehydrogenase/reductase [Chryseobacterium sp. T16E-39]|uniref:SDR family oxidoreductase n=1 Tax=Chryseobacterium sp. T16E-39 TaxID=2015076 RepID=UPI000B5B357D|nr:SDR family oxidoreductase [Chryseobacterium sp. T16E-39]ASK29230.1 short-chain dehydrogenase/reductase [Chryseobacterium sp. T16E-39]
MNKTVLITGASSGIGKATALYFAKNKWNVIATMRNPEKEKELNQYENVLVTELEVTDNDSIQKAIHHGIEQFGKIDAVINNAGYGQQGIFEAVTPEKIRAQFDVNVFGVMNVTRAILPHFRANNSGTVLNITSGAGRVTTPLLSVYSASKFAIEGFSESLAFELNSQNIKVKIVEPGYIATSFYERANQEFAFDPSLEDYKSFSEEMALFFKSFEGGSNLYSSDDVAHVIYTAVTDNTNQLRYIAGPDIEPLFEIRNSKPDQEYVNTLRHLFMPDGFKN